MGLFDFLNTGDPEKDSMLREGLLQFGLGLMSSRGRTLPAIGNAGRQSLSAMDAYKQRQFQGKLQSEQLRQIEEAKKQQAAQEAFRGSLPSPDMQASQAALAGGGGPTQANAAKIAPVDPQSRLIFGAMKAGMLSPLDYLKLQQKDDTPMIVPEGGAVVGKNGVAKFFNPKSEKPPVTAVQEYEYAKQGGYQGTFEQWVKEKARAGATNVSVSADKGFAGAFGKNAADALQASQDAAVSAQASNSTISDIRDAMKSGNVILGPGATIRQMFARAGQVAGAGTPEAAQSLANTKRVEQGLARIELEAANLIKGQGQVTENERKIVQRAAAGQIQDLTPQELEVALKAIERNNAMKIKSHEIRSSVVRGNPAVGSLGGMLDAPNPGKVIDWNSLQK